MTTTEHTSAAAATPRRARSLEQVRSVLDHWTGVERPLSQIDFSCGVTAAYRWVLGDGRAPVSGGRSRGVPDVGQLAAEERTARLMRLGRLPRTVGREYARGVHEALAWVCGLSDRWP